MRILFRWVINAVVLLGITQLMMGFDVRSFYIALIAALIIGLINAVIRPIILLITLPINVITLGLFTFVVNAAIIWFVSTFIEGFEIDGFLPALVAALILWLVGFVTNWLIKKKK